MRPVAVTLLCLAAAAAPLAQTPSKGLTEVPGVRVGHAVMAGRPTGCTVVLVDGAGAVGAMSQRGAAPGTRETDLLDPANHVDRVNAIVLAGGSAYGLDAATGVERYFEERKVGWSAGSTGLVPVVASAILIDLWFGGDPKIRPDADCGYRAARAATDGPVAEGNVGAGAGATVGKIAGSERAMKAGIGTSAVRLSNGLVVAAIVAVNALGDVIDFATGNTVAGVRTVDGRRLAGALHVLRAVDSPAPPRAAENTTIAIIATNATLSKAQAHRVGLMADDGFSRAINPIHTMADGDTVFVLATGTWDGQAAPDRVGALAADVLAEAIVRAAATAESSHGVPSARELGTVPPRLR